MKFKVSTSHIIISIIISLALLTTFAANNNKATFYFTGKFKSLRLKNKLKITRYRSLDGFELPLDGCLKKFYKDTLGIKSYELEDSLKINVIAISEYVFKDTVAACKAFDLVYPYAESVRKTRLKDWYTLCFTIPIPQVYYASRDGSHVYLYTTIYKFFYHSRDESVDTLMQSDKRILLDDLYSEMIGQP